MYRTFGLNYRKSKSSPLILKFCSDSLFKILAMDCPSESIATLLLNQWVDDALINYYGNLLQERVLINQNLIIKIADSYFFEAFQRTSAEVASRFCRDTSLQTTDLILVPCHVHYNH